MRDSPRISHFLYANHPTSVFSKKKSPNPIGVKQNLLVLYKTDCVAQEINFATASIFMDTDLLYPTIETAQDFDLVFEHLFKSHFKALHAYAYGIVRDEATAEEMVKNVFCRLW